MKNKYVLLSFLCLSMLLTPIVSHATLPVMHVGPLPFRTINVDGDPGDWAGIPPLVLDPPNDEIDPEDIIAVFGANDEDYLYFLMQFNEVEVCAAVGGELTKCEFWIDIIPGGDPGHHYTDFRIVYVTQIVESLSLPAPVDEAVLDYYNNSGGYWVRSDCSDVQGDSMGFFVEVAVSWNCIGGQSCFNCVFSASTQPGTDWAPDEGTHIVGCCPGRPPEPVGGEIIPSKTLSATAPALITVLSVFSIGILSISKRKHYH